MLHKETTAIRSLIILLLIAGCVFGDTITYNQGNNKRTIENVKFTRAGNGKVYFTAFGKETSRDCNRIIDFTDDSGSPIVYHCNAVIVEESLMELEKKIDDSLTKKDVESIDDIVADSYNEMLELSSLGAKVIQSSAVQTAMMYNIPLEVKSTFTDRQGTKIFDQESIDYTKSVTGVAYSKDDAKITLTGVQDKPGVAANIFEPLSKNQINVDMVIQNISSDQKTTDITFTIKRDDLLKTIEILKSNKNIQYESMSHNDKVSKISIVGAGMVSTPGITYRMFRSLAEEKINILAISTSEIKLSVIISEDDTLKAIKKLHTVFDLD